MPDSLRDSRGGGSWEREYSRKRCGASEAVVRVPRGGTVVHGLGPSAPPGLLGALAERVRSGDLSEVTVYSMLPMESAAQTILAPDLADRVHSRTWFVSGSDREAVREGHADFVPNLFHQIPRFLEGMKVDATVAMVSPMDRAGYFSFGLANDYISTAARRAQTLIVEVNPHMPRVFGDSPLHVTEVDLIVEHESELLELPVVPEKPEAETIGRSIAELIPDGAVLQIGVGNIPNAVCRFLEDHKDLGIHTELFCPGMVDLIQKGAVTGQRKRRHRGKHVFTNAMGDRAMYEFIADNPSLESYPVSYTNSPSVIAGIDDFVSINASLEVDLLGQCNSEFLEGHQFSGTGGQLDFVRGAYAAKGGKSVIALYSTAHDTEISRIVPRLHPGAVVTTPRMDTHWVATEFGLVDLKGKSVSERALAIIGLAHPSFRDELTRAARDMDLI